MSSICLSLGLTISCGRANSLSASTQIPFDQIAWNKAEIVAGQTNAKFLMKSAVVKRFSHGTTLNDLVSILGKPDKMGVKEDFEPGNWQSLPGKGTTFAVYAVGASEDGYEYDILFSFDFNNRLICSQEEVDIK